MTHRQDTLPRIDFQLDTIASETYQAQLDRVAMAERAMAATALFDMKDELSEIHSRATKKAAEYRPWLVRRGLIESEEEVA